MSERPIKKPILIVGAPRSGTTLLGAIFAAHSDIAYWEEPRTIWEIGNTSRPNDILTADDLTPRSAAKIKSRFARFLAKSGKSRFAEKTPANSLRLTYIHALFPDAKIIHLVRDGRACVKSILKMRDQPARPDRVWSRIRETPISGYPALVRKAFQKDRFLLRPHGWEEFSNDPVKNTVQRWLAINQTSHADREKLPSESWIELSYEAFVKNHRSHLEKLTEFCELESCPEFFAKADSIIDPKRAVAEIPEMIDAAFREFESHDSTGSSR